MEVEAGAEVGVDVNVMSEYEGRGVWVAGRLRCI